MKNQKVQKIQILWGTSPKFQRDLLLGNILKQGLETLHFAKKEINNDLSKAFNEYLKMLDFGQRFLTRKDVRSLKKYETKIDDETITGN